MTWNDISNAIAMNECTITRLAVRMLMPGKKLPTRRMMRKIEILQAEIAMWKLERLRLLREFNGRVMWNVRLVTQGENSK